MTILRMRVEYNIPQLIGGLNRDGLKSYARKCRTSTPILWEKGCTNGICIVQILPLFLCICGDMFQIDTHVETVVLLSKENQTV